MTTSPPKWETFGNVGEAEERKSIPEVIAAVSPAVAMVKVRTDDGRGNGTAFAIARHPSDPAPSVLVTNAHVVGSDAIEIHVRFPGGFDTPARLLCRDALVDLALLTTDQPLEIALPLRRSTRVTLGEQVIAIGNPFGLECSVSTGVVSGLDRSIPRTDDEDAEQGIYENVIQTDAAINPGNSGGPLLGTDECVIGVNSLGGFGVNFAVPAETVAKLYDEYVHHGGVLRASIGAKIGHFEFAPEAQHRWERYSGAVLTADPKPGSPAAAANLECADIIIEFNGQAVDHPHDLLLLLDRESIGRASTVVYLRDDEKHQTEVTPVARDDEK
jgi:S1-C subfamily serine protease